MIKLVIVDASKLSTGKSVHPTNPFIVVSNDKNGTEIHTIMVEQPMGVDLTQPGMSLESFASERRAGFIVNSPAIIEKVVEQLQQPAIANRFNIKYHDGEIEVAGSQALINPTTQANVLSANGRNIFRKTVITSDPNVADIIIPHLRSSAAPQAADTELARLAAATTAASQPANITA